MTMRRWNAILLLKTELIYQYRFETAAELDYAVSEFAYDWYNQVRPHSYNGYLNPFEKKAERTIKQWCYKKNVDHYSSNIKLKEVHFGYKNISVGRGFDSSDRKRVFKNGTRVCATVCGSAYSYYRRCNSRSESCKSREKVYLYIDIGKQITLCLDSVHYCARSNRRCLRVGSWYVSYIQYATIRNWSHYISD